jgi:chorismate synthase
VNWVAGGAIAKKILAEHGVELKAHVNQIGDLRADDVSFEDIKEHSEENEVRCADPEVAEEMRELIDQYQKEGDSIGGSIYFEARGVPRGLGAPRFDSVEARLGQAMMSVPASTAFEFGLGREAREWAGHDRNDEWEFASESGDDSGASGDQPRAGDPKPSSNRHGGLQGGITTGEPIYGEVTLHAPTSIPKTQTTVDWETGEEKEVQVVGRHDPVLPPRGVPVVEAMLALTLVDFMLLGGRINPDRMDSQPGEYDTNYHPSQPET